MCSFDNFVEAMNEQQFLALQDHFTPELLVRRKICLSMNLTCFTNCNHKFCLYSFWTNTFDDTDIIGSGAQGTVCKISRSQDNKLFAYKKLVWTEVPANREEDVNRKALGLERDINEIANIIQHERIVKYYGVLRHLNNMFIFMEYIEDSLDKRIRREEGLSYNLIAKYTKQILEGLAFLHEKKIIHRDIKSSNILLDENDNCKLTDFGLSRFSKSITDYGLTMQGTIVNNNNNRANAGKAKTLCGTIHYMSPEMMNGELYSYPIDIWSLGATMIEMLTGNPPFHDKPQNYIILQVGIHKKIDYQNRDNMPEGLINLIKLMLDPDQTNRKTAPDLLNNDWLNLF